MIAIIVFNTKQHHGSLQDQQGIHRVVQERKSRLPANVNHIIQCPSTILEVYKNKFPKLQLDTTVGED